jgi:NAD(P)-dependent dehydrogenase (short-subunit alcohol dehydrogenase family)
LGCLDGKVAIVTGAGRGIGREHALLFAAQGAQVVVNDLGTRPDGSGADLGPAEAVAEEVRANGGAAVASTHDVSSWSDAEALVQLAVDTFGRLDILVNNAGVLRDRTIVNMSEDEWDTAVRVNLKGCAAPLRFAAAHWRDRTRAGEAVTAAVVNTSSTSGLRANPGQGNYGAAKSGVATLTEIAAKELARYGVRVNAIAPAARTRLTESTPAIAARVAAPEGDAFDLWHPGNVSPLVAWLASDACTVTGRVFWIHGGEVGVFEPWSIEHEVRGDGRWTIESIGAALVGIGLASDTPSPA